MFNMKKNRLYTANRWNQPAFMVDRKHNNIYDGWQDSYLERAIQDKSANPWNYADDVDLVSQYAQQSKNGLGLSKASNPFSRMNIGSTAGNIVGAVGGVVNQLGNRFISNGYNAGGVGDGIANIGNTVGSAISTVNPLVGGIVSAASGVLGGLTNRTFGTKKNQANISAIEQNTDLAKSTGNVLAGVSDNNSLMDAAGQMTGSLGFGTTDLVKGGWAAKGKAKRMGQKYINAENAALAYQNQGLLTGATNADNNLDNTVMGNFAAYGGMIDNDSDMGAIDYGFMSDYLTQKKRENDMKSKMSGIVPMPAFMPNSFAIGGDLQTNGADWSDGLVTISAGGSHEENPYEGVQLGIDNEGTPNLVEEGETIYNDYVFSARIPIDDTTKEMFHIGKKREMTYADLSKKLEKEIAERSNDPISKAGFEKQMQMLEEQQERQKQEMEAERAKAAFEALSPEEQTALMQQRAEQEVMAQQQAAMQQPTPEEIDMVQQQMQQADGSEAVLGQEPQMNCFGGKINRFDEGGRAYTKMLNSLGFHTQKEFDDWAKENNIDLSKVWDTDERTLSNAILSNLWKDENFKKALKAKNPALAHAFSEKGYDWGAYSPEASGVVSFDDDRGNWDAQTVQGWWGSNDPAWKQVIEAHPELTKDTNLSREQLAEYLRNTDAFKKGTQWLQDSEDNRLAYLQRIINNPNAPKRAKEYALRFATVDGWKQGAARDYETIFNNPSGRAANPGTYWKTPIEAVRGNQTGNFVINEDGTIEPIIGDVPVDWTPSGNYTWADADNDYAYNYYKRPVVATSSTQPPTEKKTPEETDGKDDNGRRIVPDLRRETSFGLWGPAVGLGLMGLGIGKPDVASYDTAASDAGNYTTARWKPLGNYLTYRPLDIWYQQNALNAQSRATDRALLNSSSPSRTAGLLANGYNSQLASGNLFRQAQEYNDNLRKQVEDFNRGTNQFNSEQYGATSRFNADAYNNANRASAQMKLHAASAKDDANRWWASNLYGNINSLFDNINQWEKWKRDHNTVANMYANGLAGVVSEDTPVARGYVKAKSEGGKLKRKKRGLTI